MPQYGCDILNYASEFFNISVFITTPAFPFELKLSQNVKVYRDTVPQNQPEVILVCGAFTPFLRYVRRVAKNRGARLIFASDHCDREPDWKVFAKKILAIPNKSQPIIVPGASGVCHAKKLGFKTVATGLYASAPALNESRIRSIVTRERANRLTFVGQLNDRKNVQVLVEAFIALKLDGWRLTVVGDGPLSSRLPRNSNVDYRGFMQPVDVRQLLLDTKIFVLPSIEEHWGVVALEAASAGCALCFSSAVGAVDDFITPRNGLVFDAGDKDSLAAALIDLTGRSASWLKTAGSVSVSLSQKFTPAHFVKSVIQLGELSNDIS
jgi:glycosyltransferase involved in cell wall biosynthesis